jgi:hypothetical protein
MEIFAHDNALRPAVYERGEIEMITGHHHDVEIAGNPDDPVE